VAGSSRRHGRLVLNDNRICSLAPVRTGVLINVQQGVAIVAAGMFPWLETELVALRLDSGAVVWRQKLGKGWMVKGAMLLSPEHIIAPQGRAAPQMFKRSTREPMGPLKEGCDGSFVLLTAEDEIFHGPGNKEGWIPSLSRPHAKGRQFRAGYCGDGRRGDRDS
jgi:hypothetical protein